MTLSSDQKRKFLLVFSDQEKRQGVQWQIESRINNATFTHAQDGSEALAKINNDLPHIIITEGTLPKHTGHHVASVILADRIYDGIAIVIVSPIPDQEEFVDAVVMGRVNFVEHREDKATFNKALTRALNYCAHGDKAEFYLRFLTTDDTLIRQGDKADFVYIVKQGQLKAILNQNDKKVTLGTIEPGEFVGEMAYINGEPRFADVVAMKDCELIEIPIDQMDHLLFQKPAWSKALLKTLSKRVKISGQKKNLN